MQLKGLKPSAVTYRNLFLAYSHAQSVGASTYGARGRYARPPERHLINPSPDEEDYINLGVNKVTSLMSEQMYDGGDGDHTTGQGMGSGIGQLPGKAGNKVRTRVSFLYPLSYL